MATKRRSARKNGRVIELSDPPRGKDQRDAWRKATALARHWAQRASLLSRGTPDAALVVNEVAAAWDALRKRRAAAKRRGGRPINQATRPTIELMRIIDLLAEDGPVSHTDPEDTEPWPLLLFRQQYPSHAEHVYLGDKFFAEAVKTWRLRDRWLDIQNLVQAAGLRTENGDVFTADNLRQLWKRQAVKMPVLP